MDPSTPRSGNMGMPVFAPSNSASYQDFAGEQESQNEMLQYTTRNGSNSEQHFPVKLHYMLRDMEEDGLDHIMSWQPHGRSFLVHKPAEFAAKILPL